MSTPSNTVPTIKNVIIAGEDTYRKEQMIAYYEERGMLLPSSVAFIRKGKR